jgi:hypothetical protein
VNSPFSRARRADRRNSPTERRGWFGALIRPLRGGEKILRSRADHDASRWICAGAPSGSHVSLYGFSITITTRNTVSRTSAVAGRTRLLWGPRERQTDGSAAGGHPHFFQAPHCRQQRPAACHPASPDARSREPSPAPLRRERAGPLAFRDLARSRIRCSWRLDPVRFRPASSPTDDGDEHEGVPSKKTRKAKVTGVQPLPRSLGEGSPRAARNERRRRRGRGPPRRRRGLLPATLRNSQADFAILEKNSHGPSLRPHPPPNPTFDADVQPETRKCFAGFQDAAERQLNSVGAASPGWPATQSAKSLFHSADSAFRRCATHAKARGWEPRRHVAGRGGRG